MAVHGREPLLLSRVGNSLFVDRAIDLNMQPVSVCGPRFRGNGGLPRLGHYRVARAVMACEVRAARQNSLVGPPA